MKDIEAILKDAFKEATEVYNSINNYAVEIGVIENKPRDKKTETVEAKKDDGSKVKLKITTSADITNAELMYIHENGSPKRGLPARPVLDYTIAYTSKKLLPETLKRIEDGCFNKNWSKEDVRLELDKMCKRMQNYARQLIYSNDGRLKRNATSTVLLKGFNHPLFKTGQLARSITCRLIDITNISE